MPNTISLLISIQRLDTEINSIGKHSQRLTNGISSEEALLKKLSMELESLKKELEGITNDRKEKEEKIRENKERLEKDHKRIAEIKNDKQFKAITKEIQNAEKAIKLIEMENSALLDKLEKKKNELSVKENLLKEKTADIEKKIAEFEKENIEFENAIREKERERNSIIKTVPPGLLKRYETIREKRDGVGIVNVKNETCQGCYIHIPPQVYIQLRKGTEEVIACPHCHRILYFDNACEKHLKKA